MVLGPSTVALALLISPSLFAAGVGQADTPDGLSAHRDGSHRWAVITLCAGIAYLLSAVGPETVSLLTSSFPGQPDEGATASRPLTLETARHLIPFAIAAFVLLSGVAGILIGHVTARGNPSGATPRAGYLA